jgi:hypothetical protein
LENLKDAYLLFLRAARIRLLNLGNRKGEEKSQCKCVPSPWKPTVLLSSRIFSKNAVVLTGRE